jgi:hypothetical protein
MERREPIKLSLSAAEVIVASNALRKASAELEAESPGGRTSLCDTVGRLRQLADALLNVQVEVTFEPPYADLAEEYLLIARQDPEPRGIWEENLLGSVLAKLRS